MKELQRYDFTMPVDRVDRADFIIFLNAWSNKWVFQEEIGESGFHHWQGRVNLIKAKCEPALRARWSEDMKGIHISISSTNSGKEFRYVMKADTKVAGPWTSEMPVKYMTRDLKQFMSMEMYPWQKEILTLAKREEGRKIVVILDLIGNTGKSILAEYMEYHDLAYEIPPFNSMEDLMQCAMGISAQKAYVIDLPRGMKKEKLAQFYAGIESLKNGVMYDKRYAFKKRRIDRPQIFVFTNVYPDVKLLSMDRWEIKTITAKMNLIDSVEPRQKGDFGGAPL